MKNNSIFKFFNQKIFFFHMNNEAYFSLIKVKKQHQSVLKWFFFFFWTFISFGSNYAFDNPSALKDLIYIENADSSKPKYELLFSGFYTFYSIPNIFFPLLNGIYIDKVTLLLFFFLEFEFEISPCFIRLVSEKS